MFKSSFASVVVLPARKHLARVVLLPRSGTAKIDASAG
jgi:hypothetical protein